MLYIGNILKTEPSGFDEVWVICRSVGELSDMFAIYKNIVHIPELAPSGALFKWYRGLVHLGEWDKKHFDEYYVPEFLKDMQNNIDAQKLLKKLVDLSFEKEVVLACFCPEEKEQICHRSIVAGILLNMGANVSCDQEYGRYHLNMSWS